MKRVPFKNLPLSFWFIAVTAQGGGLDCTGELKSVGQLICRTPELLQLDRDQSAVYGDLIQESKDPEARKSEQIAWISNVRNKCKEVECLVSAYEQRNYALKFDSPWMTDDRADAICTSVQKSANKGALKEHFIPFRTRDEGEAAAKAYENRFLSYGYYIDQTLRLEHNGKSRLLGRVVGSGTCRDCGIVDFDQKVNAPYPADDEYERLRWSSWGKCDQLIELGPDLIIVKVDGEGLVGLVSWLAPDGDDRPLCYIEPVEDSFEVITLESKDRELCNAAVMQDVEIIPWSKREQPDADDRARYSRIDTKRVIEVDLNKDGKSEVISMFDYASTAGCGSYWQWLTTEDESKANTTVVSLRALLDDIPNGPLVGRWSKTELDNGRGAIRIFRYNNKPYIMTRGNNASAAVISVWGNKITNWCEFNYLPRHEIIRTYPQITWPKPEPLESIR